MVVVLGSVGSWKISEIIHWIDSTVFGISVVTVYDLLVDGNEGRKRGGTSFKCHGSPQHTLMS